MPATNANKALGPGPGVGGRIVVESAQLAAIAHQFRVDWQPASTADRAVLDRPGRPLRRDAVVRALRNALETSGVSSDCDIELAEFTAPMVPFESDPRSVVSDLSYDAGAGRFTAVLSIAGDGMEPIDMRLAGRVDDTVELPVATSRLPAGTVLRAEDVHVVRVRTSMVHGEVVRRTDDAVGLQLRHQLSAGLPLAVSGTDAAGARAEGRHRPDGARQPWHRAHRARPGAGGRFDRRTHPGAQSHVARRDRGRSDGP